MSLLNVLHKEFQEDKQALQESRDAAHTEVLTIRRLESLQNHIEGRYPDTPSRKDLLTHIQSMRHLVPKALET